MIGRLAIDIFGQNRVSCPSWIEGIVIYRESGTGGIASIYCYSNTISVWEEKDYQNCLKLAEICEKELNQEFTLKTEYKIF